jgi:phytoene desaturase
LNLRHKVLVIGAGIGGLSAAIRLATKGFDVHVIEKTDGPGGKLREQVLGAYRFDLGPSLFTMPELVAELFELCQYPMSDNFQFEKLNDICHYFYEDGTRFVSKGNVEEMIQTCSTTFQVSPAVLRRYFNATSRIYDITAHLFLYKSLHRISSYLNFKTLLSVFRLPFIQAHETMAHMGKRLFKDPRLVQYFNRYATYNGSNPYVAPATLHLIAHLEHSGGAYYPKGGMYSITKAMFQLAQAKGVTFSFGTSATKIKVDKDVVVGVDTSTGFIPCSIVVSNLDIHPTYTRLLPNTIAPSHILSQEKSSSALIFYWGIRQSYPSLGLHNIFFAKDYKKEFDAIWRDKTLWDDPTVYINITSKYTVEDAPKGGENWFVMINVPSNEGQDWDNLRVRARASILSKLERILGQSIEPFIEEEDYLDPIRIEQRTGSYRGSLYGNASNTPLAAFFRQSNASSSIKGLYFAGGSVHPGGGVPLANLSGKIVSDCIFKDYGKR